MFVDVGQTVEDGTQFQGMVDRLRVSQLRGIVLQHLVPIELLADSAVLTLERIDRMSRGDRLGAALVDTSVEYGRMQVAKRENLIFAQCTAFNQLLFYFHDFVIRNRTQYFYETIT